MDSKTDSFSWDLENLLIPENLDDLFVYSQEGSVQKQAIQANWIAQNEPLEQLEQQQQQQQQHHQLVTSSEIGMANLDQISADINDPVDINVIAPPQPQSPIEDITKKVSTSNQPTCSSLSGGNNKSTTDKYHERREKNNVASRKSREKRKMKNDTILIEIEELTLSNESLKGNVIVLEEILAKVKADLFASIVAKKTA